jgi:hypothetical protein
MPDQDAAPTLRRLIYRSRSRLNGDPAGIAAAIASILETSRNRNEQYGLTGALLMRERRFAQALEGPADAVHAVFDRIAADPRHDDVELIEDGPVPARAFPGWTMAYAGDAGAADIPLTLRDALVPASPEQEAVLSRLRQLT